MGSSGVFGSTGGGGGSGAGLLIGLVVLLFFTRRVHAFGAGNIASISKIEGQNWRHGDIEDTLLTLLISRAAGGKKFSKMDIKRVYFGNWLRDYSQAVDVGTVKYVSAEAIRIVLWVLGFMTFGYGSNEFFVSAERLGCYRPEDHIDNPKDYADNIDARDYDRRLRGPVDERVELAIDPNTGMKNYIANEQAGCMTSAQHVRRLFGESIRLGRSYARSNNKDELYEALRLLGTGLHCLEDFSAHSNYTELALIELGERDIFPHVGRRTAMDLQSARDRVFPLITGTFGGVDFLHSMMGEFTDKATQSEIEQLEGSMQNQRSDESVLKDLLNKIPAGLFGGKDEAKKADEIKANATTAQMNQMRVSPREPEAFTRQMQQVSKDIYPIIEWHDELMKSISEAIEKIPILPELLEQFEEQLNRYVFSLIAPFVIPIINQIKNELNTGSSEVIQSSKDKQLIVFNEDGCSDPTHSMLSKDHFSNVLNEPAGKIASAVLKWVVPQIMACYDDTNVDVDRTLNRIIHGVFHHPAQRNLGQDGASDGRNIMFNVVQRWWQECGEQNDLRRKLSRDGVYRGENHKEGVHDTGHGCCKPIGMTKNTPNITGGLGSPGGVLNQAIGQTVNQALGQSGQKDDLGKKLLGGLAGALGGGLLSGLAGKKDESSYQSEGYTQDGGYQRQTTQYSQQGGSYQQSSYQETSYPSGERIQETRRFEQDSRGGHGYEDRVQERPTHSGAFERTEERKEYGGGYREEDRSHDREGKKYGKKDDSDDEKKKKKKKDKEYGRDDDSEDERKKKKKGYGKDNDSDEDKKKKKSSSGYGKQYDSDEEKRQKKSYGKEYDSDEEKKRKKREKEQGEYGRGGGGGYAGQQQSYGETGGYGRGAEQSYGRQEQSYGQQEQSYGRQEQSYGQQSYGQQQQGYGTQQQSYGGDSGRSQGYSGQEQSYGGNSGREQSYGSGEYGRQETPSYGGANARQDTYGSSSRGGGYDNQGSGRQEQSYGRTENYGQDQGYRGRGDEYGQEQQQQSYGRGDDDSYGGGYGRQQGGGEDVYGRRRQGGYDE